MKKWLEIATENLLAKSLEQTDFDQATEEWRVTEKVIDNYLSGNGDLPSCELCRHEKLRWQFEIVNRHNQNALLVGSNCITKFDIPISSNAATVFHGKIRDGLLLHRIAEIKSQYVKNHIAELLERLKGGRSAEGARDVELIERIERHWSATNAFTPRMAADFVGMCARHAIDIREIELNVSLRTIDDRIEVLRLGQGEYERIVPYLDEGQARRCAEIRRSVGGAAPGAGGA
jgi:hypothetical protein